MASQYRGLLANDVDACALIVQQREQGVPLVRIAQDSRVGRHATTISHWLEREHPHLLTSVMAKGGVKAEPEQQACPLCDDERRATIELLIRAGVGVTRIANMFYISESAILWHRDRHLQAAQPTLTSTNTRKMQIARDRLAASAAQRGVEPPFSEGQLLVLLEEATTCSMCGAQAALDYDLDERAVAVAGFLCDDCAPKAALERVCPGDALRTHEYVQATSRAQSSVASFDA
jgi:hypothetical protein